MPRLLIALLGLVFCVAACPADQRDQLEIFYEQLQKDLLRTHPPLDGAWENPMHDAQFWAAALFWREGHRTNNTRYIEIATAARDHNINVVRRANDDLAWLIENLNESVMALMALIEIAAQSSAGDFLPDVDKLIDKLTSIAGEDHYVDLNIGLGPTLNTVAIGSLNTHYGALLSNPRRAERIESAKRIMAALDERAFDGQKYLFDPDDRLKAVVYTNATVLTMLAELAMVTEAPSYLSRARDIFQLLQAYKSEETKGYFLDPGDYKAPPIQPGDDPYDPRDKHYDLSILCYIVVDDLFLYQTTRSRSYLDDAREVLDFVRTNLYHSEQKVLAHHMHNGVLPDPVHGQSAVYPVFYCLGCNYQYLYLLRNYLDLL